MKVFVSSTCYDLVDLRAELHEDLRQMGVEAHFSDAKNSDFIVTTEPTVNSIEACLASLRACDLVIFVLSQRYGPLLGHPFGSISATHCEYNEAKKTGKRILFYVRNELWGDYSAWKRNNRSADFKVSWAVQKDALGLFGMIDDHVKLTGEDGKANSNNWRDTFTNSVDLRADIRKHLKPQLDRFTAEGMIQRGETPLIIINEFNLHTDRNSDQGPCGEYVFVLVNVGPIPAFDVKLSITFQGIVQKERFCQIPAILPAVSVGRDSQKIAYLNIDGFEMKKITDAIKSFKMPIWYRCTFEYSVSVGLTFRNMVQGYVAPQNDVVRPQSPHEFAGMNYVGPLCLIRH